MLIPHQPDQVMSSGVSGSRMARITDSFHLLLLLLWQVITSHWTIATASEMIEISLLGKRINRNWAFFVSLKSLFRVGIVGIVTIKMLMNAVSVRFAVSHFRYRQSPETSDISFVQTVQSLRFTTFVILRNPFEIIATTFASHGRCSNYKNGHAKRPNDESRRSQNTRFIYSLTAGRHQF